MIITISRKKIVALCGVAILAALWVFGAQSQAQAQGVRHSTSGDLFYNYYAQPSGDSEVSAKMYPSPRPVPAFVGNTWVTYQPLMPHEMLYKHSRVYRTAHPDAAPTRTRVRWR